MGRITPAYRRGFEAAKRQAAEFARHRSAVSFDAADMYAKRDDVPDHFEPSERCAAIEARHIAEKIEKLVPKFALKTDSAGETG